jgi:hypothetical protein
MYQFLDVEEFSPVRVIATVAKSYLHSPTPNFFLNIDTKTLRYPDAEVWIGFLEVGNLQTNVTFIEIRQRITQRRVRRC